MSKVSVAVIRWLLPALVIIGGVYSFRRTDPIAYALPHTTLNSPDAAYDAMVSGAIRANDSFAAVGERPADALRRELAKVPLTTPIFYVGSRKTPGDLALRLVVSALAWPRPIYTPKFENDSGGDYPAEGFKSDTAIYFHVKPVSEEGRLILPEVRIVKTSEPRVWNSFCPR